MNTSRLNPVRQDRIVLETAEREVVDKLKTLKVNFFGWTDSALSRDLKQIKAERLNDILSLLFLEMQEEGKITDPIALLNQLAAILPLNELLEARSQTTKGILEEIKRRNQEAKHYLELTEPPNNYSLYARLLTIRDGLVTLIESLISEFDLGQFFSNNEDYGYQGRKQLSTLIFQYGSLTANLLPTLGLAKSGEIMAIFAGSIALLSLIWPYIKPVPTYLPGNAKNWTRKSLQGGYVPQASAETLRKIREALKNNQHVLLVGPPRVGKTLTARAYVHAMAKGEYEEAKGSVAFYWNMASILGGGPFIGEVQVLNAIGEAISSHPDRVYLIFDEMQNACKKKGAAEGQLLSLLDDGGEFRHVIGLTTDSEYNRYFIDKKTGQSTPLAKRFCIINIKGTDDNETIRILNDKVLTSLSKPLITPDAIDAIYTACKGKGPQPHTPILLLKECIKEIKTQQTSKNEKELDRMNGKISRIYAEMAATRGAIASDQLDELLEEKQWLEGLVKEERKPKDDLLNAKKQFDTIAAMRYRSILKIASIGNDALHLTSAEEKELKFYALLELVMPLLNTYLETQSDLLKIQLTIDEACVRNCAQKLFAAHRAQNPKRHVASTSLSGHRVKRVTVKLPSALVV